jgi:hypothetical protein
MIAIDGGWGTVSEIAHALRNDTPVIGLKSPAIGLPRGNRLTVVHTVEEALAPSTACCPRPYNYSSFSCFPPDSRTLPPAASRRERMHGTPFASSRLPALPPEPKIKR